MISQQFELALWNESCIISIKFQSATPPTKRLDNLRTERTLVRTSRPGGRDMPVFSSFVAISTLLVLAQVPNGQPVQEPADALLPAQIHSAILELDSSDFEIRERAVDRLFAMGLTSISPLEIAAQNGSPEVSVRAFDVLRRLYHQDDEPLSEAIENAFLRLKHVENLAVTGRAERAFESLGEIRQKRAVAKIEQLGGIVHLAEQNLERQIPGRSRIEYIMLGRYWTGGEAGLKFLERIDDIRDEGAQLYIIRGVEISDATLLDLKAELPNLHIQRRGPARLGVTSQAREAACIIRSVEPGSSADRAGLKTGDQIVEIDGREINSFDELVEIVGEKQPGDQVPIVFRRERERVETVAELSDWKKPAPANAQPPKP